MTRRCVPNKTLKVVSPQENQTQTEAALSILKTTKFVNNYIHPHRRITVKLAIPLTNEDTFNKFAKALASLLGNAQIVNPKFVINPIKPFSKDKNITTKTGHLYQHDQARYSCPDLRQWIYLSQETADWGQGNTRKEVFEEESRNRPPNSILLIDYLILCWPQENYWEMLPWMGMQWWNENERQWATGHSHWNSC